MKEVKIVAKIIDKTIHVMASLLLLLIFILFVWLILGAWPDLIPVTRTNFTDVSKFEAVLADNNSFATEFFCEEVPASASSIEYYWHRRFVEKLAAYSMVVSDNDYLEFQEERRKYYKDSIGRSGAEQIVYMHESEKYYVEDSELYQEYFSFVDGVLHDSGMNQQYYFLVIHKVNTANGVCYNGVILNDTTKEVIEFSCEKMESEEMR